MRLMFAVRFAAVAAVMGAPTLQVQPSGSATLCRLYDNGEQNLRQGNYAEALKDFNLVATGCPVEETKAQAWLRIGEIDLAQTPPLLKEARIAAEEIIAKYAEAPSAGFGFVLRGRAGLVERSPNSLLAALKDFARVSPAVFPGSAALPAALFYSGEASRLSNDPDQAISRYRDVALRYPASEWNAKALLGIAKCYARFGETNDLAMQALQRVRTDFVGTKEAVQALNEATILYRLNIKAPTQPLYAFTGQVLGGTARPFRDVAGIVVDAAGQIMVADRDALAIFGPDGSAVRTVTYNGAPGAIGRAANGSLAIGRADLLTIEGASAAAPLQLNLAQPPAPPRPAQITALAATWRGDWLVGDDRTKEVHRFDPAGASLGRLVLASGPRIAINGLDEIAVLDQDTKNIKVFSREGDLRATVERRTGQYELASPVDLAFDSLDNLYVLDRGQAAVLVFDPQRRFRRTFTVAAKAPGAFRKPSAFAVDRAGRLYIFDEDAHAVLVFQ